MESLFALGVAANIAQFVDMGIGIVRNAKEIAGIGATVSTLHLASLASDIGNIGAGMASKCQESSLDTIPEEEKVRNWMGQFFRLPSLLIFYKSLGAFRTCCKMH